MPDSWVIGNSSQLNLLTPADRQRLDSEPFVFCLNHFPSHWRTAGFRPTHWVFGDTNGIAGRNALLAELHAIESDAELRQRLKQIYFTDRPLEMCHLVISQTPEGTMTRREPFAEQIGRAVPALRDIIRTYHRGPARRQDQPIARTLEDRVYHFASTITDAVNLAAIINPGRPVYVVGCEYGGSPAHFYRDDPPMEFGLGSARFVTKLWAGLHELRRQGIDVRDANLKHCPAVPAEIRLPREPMFEASE